jgi:hypothetical protein
MILSNHSNDSNTHSENQELEKMITELEKEITEEIHQKEITGEMHQKETKTIKCQLSFVDVEYDENKTNCAVCEGKFEIAFVSMLRGSKIPIPRHLKNSCRVFLGKSTTAYLRLPYTEPKEKTQEEKKQEEKTLSNTRSFYIYLSRLILVLAVIVYNYSHPLLPLKPCSSILSVICAALFAMSFCVYTGNENINNNNENRDENNNNENRGLADLLDDINDIENFGRINLRMGNRPRPNPDEGVYRFLIVALVASFSLLVICMIDMLHVITMHTNKEKIKQYLKSP